MKIVSNLLGEMVELRTKPFSKDSGSYLEVRGIVRAVYRNKSGICLLIEKRDDDSGSLVSYAMDLHTVLAVAQCERCATWHPKHRMVKADYQNVDGYWPMFCKPGDPLGCRAKERA